MSITGRAYSVQGGYGREGYLLCQKHLNAQGGLLGRPVELVIHDDESDEKTAARLYEKLITEDKVEAILGPYGTAITEAVADIPDKHRKVMVAANAATSSIWEKGRKYLIMVLAPVNSAAIGALDLAARNDLKKLAIINQDALLPKAVANTTNELAKNKSLDVVAFETYPTGTKDFSAILEKVRDAAPDLLIAAAVRLDDHVAIIREMKKINLDTKMVSSLPYGLLPEFYQQLGKDAEFVYSATFWEASLPNPGNREFVAAYQKEFNRAPAVQSANSYAGCQIFAEAVRHAGTTDSEKLREALLTLQDKDHPRRLCCRSAWISDWTEGRDDPVAGRKASRCLAGRVRGFAAFPDAELGQPLSQGRPDVALAGMRASNYDVRNTPKADKIRGGRFVR